MRTASYSPSVCTFLTLLLLPLSNPFPFLTLLLLLLSNPFPFLPKAQNNEIILCTRRFPGVDTLPLFLYISLDTSLVVIISSSGGGYFI